MPFTLSHAVLAPPLARLSRGHLPIAALAIGCMTPDLYRLFTTETIALTHQWSGILFPQSSDWLMLLPVVVFTLSPRDLSFFRDQAPFKGQIL